MNKTKFLFIALIIVGLLFVGFYVHDLNKTNMSVHKTDLKTFLSQQQNKVNTPQQTEIFNQIKSGVDK